MANQIDNMFTWLPQIYGTNIDTGSGAKIKTPELRKTGEVFTGYEIIESYAAEKPPKSFKVVDLLKDLQGDLQVGSLIIQEHPTPSNQLGKYYFDTSHPINMYGKPKDCWSRVRYKVKNEDSGFWGFAVYYFGWTLMMRDFIRVDLMQYLNTSKDHAPNFNFAESPITSRTTAVTKHQEDHDPQRIFTPIIMGMEVFNEVSKWLPQIYGKNVGTGSGDKFTLLDYRASGQQVTGYEILESVAAEMGRPFKVTDFLTDLQNDLNRHTLVMHEAPTQHNQLGRFHFDPNHPINIYGPPPGTGPSNLNF